MKDLNLYIERTQHAVYLKNWAEEPIARHILVKLLHFKQEKKNKAEENDLGN